MQSQDARWVIKLLLLVIALIAIIAVFSAASKPARLKFISDSPLDVYEKAAVVTNSPECAQIGSDILKLRNGSAVDAAIAALLCDGVASFSSMGLGGGFFMTIYDAPSGKADFLDARETAPGLANSTMFGGNQNLSRRGGLSVAVPGELLGYWEAHQKYGRVPWKELFEPTIELCKRGSIITKYLEYYMIYYEKYIRASPTMSEILVDPLTNRLLGEGDKIKQPQLAKTLKELAEAKNPVDLFYKGRIAKQLTDEIKSFGGIVTAEDFANYKVQWKSPIEAQIVEKTMYTAPPPGSGALLTFMLNVLKDLVPAKNDKILWQRIVETFKWAYAKRTELDDPDFVDIAGVVANLTSPDYADSIRSIIENGKTYDDPKYYGAVTVPKNDGGTAHISVLAPDGSAVSVTSTINWAFGAMIRSRSTGIIFNDEMDDFSAPDVFSDSGLPPSANNLIQPHKRPFSSMAPTIVTDDNGKVELVIGAAGGTKITSTVASIMVLHLWNGYDIKEAVDAQRLHHQLFPMAVQAEDDFPKSILNYLKEVGYAFEYNNAAPSTASAIAVKNGVITANSDYRRQGKTAGF